jgi:hypothetical protein
MQGCCFLFSIFYSLILLGNAAPYQFDGAVAGADEGFDLGENFAQAAVVAANELSY